MSSTQRIYALTGAASGIGYATKQLIESRGGRVIGIDIRDADVVADLATPDGRAAMIEKVTDLSGGTIDAILAIAGVDTAGPATIAVNYYGAIATLALQLRFSANSESIGLHDSEVMDDECINRDNAGTVGIFAA